MGVLFSWWLLVEVVGVVSLPMASVLCAHLPDRGWGLARPLGLLVLGWLVWFPLSVVHALPYSGAWIAGTLAALALGNAALLRQARLRERLRAFVARERGYILACEGVFAGALALMGWLRSFTPAVVDTEKYMDVAFLAAIWRAPHLPAPDPWLSGQPINYYYFGHFMMATLAKLLGTQPAVAFNAAVALTFALTAVAVFALATNLVAALRHTTEGRLRRAAPFGLASVLLVLVLGNLDGAVVWWGQAVAAVRQHTLSSPWAWWTQGKLWTQFDWWSPSRAVPNTITEFPAFSFILADLHAHVLALPFATLAVAVALNLALARGAGLRAFGDRGAGVLALLLSALALGGLYAINGWDLPTYLGLALLALGTQQWIEHGRRWGSVFALNLIASGVMLIALAVLLYIPFYGGFVSPAQGIGIVPLTARTLIGNEVTMFGLPIFLVGSLVVVRLVGLLGVTSGPPRETLRVRTLVAVAALALLGLWTLTTARATAWVLVWSMLLVAGCAALALRGLAGWRAPTGRSYDDGAEAGDSVRPDEEGAGPRGDERGEEARARRADVFLWCVVGTAAALIGACELIYLRDVFGGGDYFRMNTVFKLYYQAWLLLGVTGGVALAELLARARAVLGRALPPVVGPGDDGWARTGSGEVADAAGVARVVVALRVRTRALMELLRVTGGAALAKLRARSRVVMAPLMRTRAVEAALARMRAMAAPLRMTGGAALARLRVWTRALVARSMPAAAPTRGQGWASPGGHEMDEPLGVAQAAPAPLAVASARSWMHAEVVAGRPAERAGVSAAGGAATARAAGLARLEAGASPIRASVLRWVAVGGTLVWIAVLVTLVGAAAVYPMQAAAARTDNYSLPRSLDGTLFMATDPLNQGDAAAIAWLNAHVQGDPVLVEAVDAQGGDYTHFGRVSAFTGLPAVMGWVGHEWQWRVNWVTQPAHMGELDRRQADVNLIYTSADPKTVRALLARYDVRYVYVGAAERQRYPNVNMGRFSAFLHVVYDRDGVTIYAVS